MDTTIKLTDIAIVVSTLLGPVLAVQAQKWVEGAKAIRSRRQEIFRALMATRATRLSAAHVEGLNSVPVEFYGNKAALKLIQERWHYYQDLLNRSDSDSTVLFEKRNDAFIDLLYQISRYLGYSFGRSELQKDVYYPTGHVEVETDQVAIRRGLSLLLQGQISIPMAVKEFPSQNSIPDAEAEQLKKLFKEWLEGTRAVQVCQK